MVLIFTVSALMLYPRTRANFKTPVPHIHDTIGKLMIPWGITYVIFLPDIYLTINGIPWRDHAYIIITMVTIVMCLSCSSWTYMAYLQQGVRQRILQPFILFLPTFITLWYTISPADWLMQTFITVCFVESLLISAYYIKLYFAFIRDLKSNYSNISKKMQHGIWTMWGASIFSVITFILCAVLDSVTWNIVNILVNIFSFVIFIYTSEHLMPLPEKKDGDTTYKPEDIITDEKEYIDIEQMLYDNCEKPLLFCNPDLSLPDLALALGTNRTYLSKWFAMNNNNFYLYINNLRIEYAAELLRSTDDSITQIQHDAGFMSKTTFRKYFLDHFGCSPSEYRKVSPDTESNQ